MDNRQDLKTHILILLLLVVALLPYLYASIFCMPVADDLIYSAKGRDFSLADNLVGDYFNWNGRYFSNILVFVNPVAFGSFWGYKLIPAVLILFTIVSFYLFLRTVLKKRGGAVKLFEFSLGAALLYFNQMPIISEGIYWYTGAVSYHLGNLVFLWYLSLLVLFVRGKLLFKNQLVHFGLLVLLLFMVVGFNETVMIYTVLFSLVLTAVFWRLQLPKLRQMVYLLLFCACFASLMFFSPGNNSREAFFTDNHRFFFSLYASFTQTVRFFFEWISSAPLLFVSVLYYPLSRNLSAQIPVFRNSFHLKLYESLGLLLLVIFVGAFPAYWATGMLGQHRTMNVAYFMFLLMWFVNLTVLYNNVKVSFYLRESYKMALVFLIICSLSFTKNGYDLLNDIRSGDCAAFDAEMDERFEKCKSDADTIYFNPIVNRPKSLFVLDVEENPHDWKNRAYCAYFNKSPKTILLKK